MKKKILLLSTFIIAVVVILCTGNKKEVKAEGENCPVYYNYYLFLDASRKDNLMKFVEPASRTTGKTFHLGLPENAKYVSSGMVELNINDSLSNNDICGKSSWNLEQFYNKFIDLGVGEVQYSSNFVEEDGINGDCSYAKAFAWRENDEDFYNKSDETANYNEFKSLVPLGIGNPTINEVTDVDVGTAGIDSDSSFLIKRSWKKSELEGYNDADQLRSPAVYYVSYELCEDKAPTYTLTVEHFLDDTTTKLEKDYVKSGYKTGEDYEYNCPPIDGYTVVNSTNKPSAFSDTFETSDINKKCYYTENPKEEKTYTLTINYGSDENCSKTIANPTTYDGLKAGDVQTHEIKSAIGELTNPKLGTVSNAFKTKPTLKDNKISATMPAKNVEVCIVYTPKTGASWIYLVWVIGGLALGYSIWYFVRYYKKQNSEI